MEKKRELSKEEMSRISGGDEGNVSSGRKIVTCTKCHKPFYANASAHVAKCPHCGWNVIC